MYDEIVWKYPLPIQEYQGRIFQTKDLECQMYDYEVREDGTLWREHCDLEPYWDGGRPLVRKKNSAWLREDYSGEIIFYDFADENALSGWVSFIAVFDGGSLVCVNVFKHVMPGDDDGVDT